MITVFEPKPMSDISENQPIDLGRAGHHPDRRDHHRKKLRDIVTQLEAVRLEISDAMAQGFLFVAERQITSYLYISDEKPTKTY